MFEYIGSVTKQPRNGETLVEDGGLETRLGACDECGAAIPEGSAQNQHVSWHRGIRTTIGDPNAATF